MSCLIQISSSSNGCETHNVKINMKCILLILLNEEFSFNAYHKNEMRKNILSLEIEMFGLVHILGDHNVF